MVLLNCSVELPLVPFLLDSRLCPSQSLFTLYPCPTASLVYECYLVDPVIVVIILGSMCQAFRLSFKASNSILLPAAPFSRVRQKHSSR